MRLGQLARKLALRPSQLIDYLATHQIFPEEGSNAKLTDELTEKIVLHFAPERLSEIKEADKTPEPVAEPVIETIEAVAVKEEENSVSEIEQTQPEVPAESSSAEKVDVIKAQKVELSGLKVLGKIELKEAKKKEQPAEESTEEKPAEENKIESPKRKKYEPRRKPTREEREWRNPIAVQREREAREAAEKRKKEIEQEKERRTLNYQKRVKHSQPIKPTKIYQEETEQKPELKKKSTEKPKGLIGRFLHWLNS